MISTLPPAIRRALSLSIALGTLLAALPLAAETAPQAGTLRDSVGGSVFEGAISIDGTAFQCLGAGGHKILFYKVYSNAFCVDQATSLDGLRHYVQSAHPGLSGKKLKRALMDDPKFFELLSTLPGNKLIQIRFLRDLRRNQVVDAMRKAMTPILPPGDVARVSEAFNQRDPRKGETALLFSSGEDFGMRLGDTRQTLERAPDIAQKIWLVWLREGTPTPNLRESLADAFSR